MLVPNKDEIEKTKNCECGPTRVSKAQQRKNMSHFEWGKRIRLEAIPNTKKIELMDFYNKKLKEVKFTRNSVVVIKSNGSREK